MKIKITEEQLRKIIREEIRSVFNDIDSPVQEIVDQIQSHIDSHTRNNNLWCVGTSSSPSAIEGCIKRHKEQKENPESKRTAFKNWMEPIYHFNSQVIETSENSFTNHKEPHKRTEGGPPPEMAPAQHYIYAYQCFESESDLES